MAKKNQRKALAVILTLALLLSCTTIPTFASSYIDGDSSKSYDDGQLDQAFNDATESVTLTGDETVSVEITIGSGQDITLDLNGNTVSKGSADESVFGVESGGELTITDSGEDGAIVGTSGSTAIISVDGGTLNLEDGALKGNSSTTDGGAIDATNGATVNISGGEISGNTATEGGGIYAENSNVNITGGAIDSNTATDGSWVNTANSRPAGGGGVAIVGNGGLNMSDGVISNNFAQGGGGGISVRESDNGGGDPTLTITGGDILNNTAETREGGGIRLEGSGTINPTDADVNITGNVSNSTFDLGGGGIFLVNDSDLVINNAVITGNSAGGLGGGVAGCIHGEITSLSPDGAAIYGNTAAGENYTENGAADKSGAQGVVDEVLGTKKDAEGNVTSLTPAQDIFVAGNALVGDTMPGGGSANWSGIIDGQEVAIGAGSAAYSDDYMGMTADPTEAAKEAANAFENGRKVLISGNYARNHGGGVAANGDLTFGSTTASSFNEMVTGVTVEAQKTLVEINTLTENEFDLPLNDYGFTFELLDAEGNVVALAKNDDNGKVSFEIPASCFGDAGEYTFTMREMAGDEFNMIYDPSVYTVKVTVAKSEDVSTVTLGKHVKHTVTKYTYSVTGINIYNAEGAEVENPSFKNIVTYTPDPTSIVIFGYKMVNEGAPEANFEFLLMDEEDRIIDRQTLTGPGEFTFDEITYEADQAGVHVYSVVEVATNETGWTYDTTVYTVVVVVDANDDGELTASIAVNSPTEDNVEVIRFYNSYEPYSPPDDPYVPPTPPEDPPTPPTTPPEDPPTDIPDDPVPLTDLPDEEVPLTDIPDEEVPKTGGMGILFATLFAAAGMGLTGLGLTGRRKEEE